MKDGWCKPEHCTIKERFCSRDIELFAVSIRPYYLPCELSHVIVIAVYSNGCPVLSHQQAPDTAFDFNHVSPSSVLPSYTQYVTCPTREDKVLDLFFANIKEAYTVIP